MITDAIRTVVAGDSLSSQEMESAFDEIMTGNATSAQIAGLAIALRMRGETAEEIAAAARIMRKHATPVRVEAEIFCDTCGTGGDGAGTFNISTTAAFVVAGAGIPVAKHGNRGVSSRSGSADVLAELGIDIEAEVPAVERAIAVAGIGFLFAPRYHGALKHAAAPRRELGVRTIFNLLGPLANPAQAPFQLVGIYDGSLLTTVAEALNHLGVRGALVVHGTDGLDEITLTGSTYIAELHGGKVVQTTFDPTEWGFELCSMADLAGGSPADNARTTRAILEGEGGPRRDIVVLNAAAALKSTRQYDDWAAAIGAARESLDSKGALRALEKLREVCGT